MNHDAGYTELLGDIVSALESAVGPGYASQALGLQHPLAPPGGVSEDHSRQMLATYTNELREVLGPEKKRAVTHAADLVARFLDKTRHERLRQAKTTFNLAVTLVVLGMLLIFVCVCLLLSGHTTAGVVSAAVSALSNGMSALVFKLNKDANDRLDKETAGLSRVRGTQRAIECLDKSQLEH